MGRTPPIVDCCSLIGTMVIFVGHAVGAFLRIGGVSTGPETGLSRAAQHGGREASGRGSLALPERSSRSRITIV